MCNVFVKLDNTKYKFRNLFTRKLWIKLVSLRIVKISLSNLSEMHQGLHRNIFSSSGRLYNSIFLIKQIGIQLKNIVALSAMQHHHNSPCYIDGHGHIDILTHLGWYDVIMMKLKSVTDTFTTLVISRVVFATKNVNSRVL